MSQGYQRRYQPSEPPEPLVWERVEWRQGDGRYTFEVAQGGLHATLASPHGSRLTLPMVAWEGLLDALSAARKTKTRSERSFPARSGARWYEGEAGELASAFKAGRSITQLARAHHRSEFAVEAELDRQGLWDRIERRRKQKGDLEQPLGGGAFEPEPVPGDGSNPIPFAEDRD